MSSGSEPGVVDRPGRGLGADLTRGAARRLRVRGLTDPDDRDVAVDVVELRRVSPVGYCRHGREANVRSCPPSLDPATTVEAVAGNLNLIEFTREDTRWQRPHTILEVDGVMLFAGASDFPAYNNGVHRVDDTTPGTDVIARAGEFFAARRRGWSAWVRDTGEDEDLREAAEAAGLVAFGDSPQMICRERLPDRPLPEGVEIRMVTDVVGAAAVRGRRVAGLTSASARPRRRPGPTSAGRPP